VVIVGVLQVAYVEEINVGFDQVSLEFLFVGVFYSRCFPRNYFFASVNRHNSAEIMD